MRCAPWSRRPARFVPAGGGGGRLGRKMQHLSAGLPTARQVCLQLSSLMDSLEMGPALNKR